MSVKSLLPIRKHNGDWACDPLMKVLQYLYILSIKNWVSVVTFMENYSFSSLYTNIKWNYAHNSENFKLMYIEIEFFFSISKLMHQQKDFVRNRILCTIYLIGVQYQCFIQHTFVWIKSSICLFGRTEQ